ncbi:MAG: aldo/keto reductase [Candidatus Abyssobacteria bacterium SURF_17]|uniref:Aldo/keto reductase n=1 Tax=Candidatus Abyssobacteria bacterium SURF_17 TaxID=2093361 RepID=A0A419EN12_9BACT|nr:MAG: aldo/keto reductase [Candidatus Abyssubacteria bacterium SURF_17]
MNSKTTKKNVAAIQRKPRTTIKKEQLVTRMLGRTGRVITTFGLGGQASIQWPKDGVDSEVIILKAIEKGVTYFDTSNIYGPSQLTYGKAFRRLHLVPGVPGFDSSRRERIFLATKTHMRRAVVRDGDLGPSPASNGEHVKTAADDVRRSLSQIFGDGRGNYPPDAYLDLVQIHSINTIEEVDAFYEGLDNPDPTADHIGALAGLLDLRDGTNRTGVNPRGEKLIRHIGITGHWNSAALMEAIQRDTKGIIDTLLVAINSNDRLYFNHQHNVIPVAKAKGMGVIGMKVFADAKYYGRTTTSFSNEPDDVYMRVGSKELPSAPLVHYSLSVPGVDCVIIGIGHVSASDNPEEDQLVANIEAAQIREPLSPMKMREIEERTAEVAGADTNYFQHPSVGLTPPRGLRAMMDSSYMDYVSGAPAVYLAWDTSYAGRAALSHYEISRGGQKMAEVPHAPQTTLRPFTYRDGQAEVGLNQYRVRAVDTQGGTSDWAEVSVICP